MPIPSLFAGFNSAIRAMQTTQFALNLHGHNIAHANDPNYTRKDLLPMSQDRIDGPGIARIRDAFSDDQFRRASARLGESEITSDVMGKVEDILGDPVNGGLRQAIDQFFDSWKGLSENPSDGVSRLQVLIDGRSFAQQIQTTYKQLNTLAQTVDEQITARVDEVNNNLQRVFTLNKQISELKRNNLDDSELRDQRDVALDSLAKLTGAYPLESEDGTVRVIVGNTPVVDGPTVLKLQTVTSAGGPVPAWDVTGSATFGGGGTLAGLVSVRDEQLAQLKSEIDTLGKTVADRVNTLHQRLDVNGNPGKPFFLINAQVPADIVVNPSLRPEEIAADAGTGLPSDGENARKLAALAEEPILTSQFMPNVTQNARTFYRNLVGWVGAQASEANQLHDMASTHVAVALTQRQTKSGVSLDEEVANLQAQQKAFAAAARVMAVMDEVLDSLINKTGW